MKHIHTGDATQPAERHTTTQQEPCVAVGIVSGERIAFALNQPYRVGTRQAEGNQTAVLADGAIVWQGQRCSELLFTPATSEASFSLKDVTIGINFHWERQETQTFRGSLRLITDGGKIVAINVLPVEQYLESVISSEMSATSSLQLLKAHAVISRSWLLAQMDKRGTDGPAAIRPAFVQTDDTLIRWYDREDHTLFDVCADDHCQRYQGITKETSPHVAEAIRQTRGQVLTADGVLCDARFAKCCGGALEEFQYCWEDSPKSYLRTVRDWLPPRVAQLAAAGTDAPTPLPDLTQHDQAERWIRSRPDSFCNTSDRTILAQVLNDYDQETTDFYRWQVVYTQQEIATLIDQKLQQDLGSIVDLVPVGRGKSGRIVTLKIVGTRRTLTIGKELEIRRALSPTHLYSSAFVVDRQDIGADGLPARFVLTGAGWGHGVGLCQIGAAVMGERGYSYDQILNHYYPGADITTLYI